MVYEQLNIVFVTQSTNTCGPSVCQQAFANSYPCPYGTPPVMKNDILPCRVRQEQRSGDSRA